MSDMKIEQGRVYRAKKPKAAGAFFAPVFNDRQVLWVGETEVQYDSPTLANGRHYPKVSLERFLKWAGEDVTEQMPEGNWARWTR